MANICMDTVVFYAAFDKQEKGLAKLRQALNECYPAGVSVNGSELYRIFEQSGIPTDGLNLRSDVVEVSTEDSHIILYCDSAWSPMYDAYLHLADHFGVCFELMAESSGDDIYINTDINGAYLTTHYKAYLSDRPKDGSLDALFDEAGTDTDFYFDSEKDLLQWFQERGGITADSAQTLQDMLPSGYVSIHEFVNPY